MAAADCFRGTTRLTFMWICPASILTMIFAVKNEAALITVGGLTIGAILAPSIAPLALGIAGFTPIGPLAGSAAAAIQSSIGNIAAGSLYATAQGISMGGVIPTSVYYVGALAGAGLGRLSAKAVRTWLLSGSSLSAIISSTLHAYQGRCQSINQLAQLAGVGLTVGGAAIGALLAPVVAPPLLGIVGFSAAGPVAGQGLLNTDQGTIAAAIQSSIGNVAAGSAFAVCQSVAMGGALPALGYAAGAAGGAAAAAKITDGGGNGGQGGLPGGGGGPGPNGGGGGPGHDGPGPHGGGGGGPPPYTSKQYWKAAGNCKVFVHQGYHYT
ncbi:hypothetical protein C8Q72DRAFT_795360 [Fomitopsis betulina]|nr:hypothetical protein C8Q72DRAFT_795360 [Fomitopsis betulina]